MAKKKNPRVLAHPHDALFKIAMGDIRVAKEMMQSYLPAEILACFKMSTLRINRGCYVDDRLAQSASDIVYSAQTHSAGRGYLYCLWEHQSSPDRHMMLRFLSYTCRIMEAHLKQGHKYLPLVIPALVYNGTAKPYPFSCDLFDGFEDKQLAKKLMFQPATLVDLTVMPDDDILRKKWSAFLQMLLKHMRLRDLLPIIEKLQPHIRYLHRRQGVDILSDMLQCLILTNKISDKDKFINVVTASSKDTGENIMTLAEEWFNEGVEKGVKRGMEQGMERGVKQGMERGIERGVKRGMEQGMERGIERGMERGMERGVKQGMRQIVSNMIQKGLDTAQISKLSGVAIDEVKKMMRELKEKV